MRTIDLDELLVTIDLIIEDEDTDELYIGHEICRHFFNNKPQCLVGQVFAEYGVEQYTLPTNATTRTAGGAMDYLQRHGVLAFTRNAQDFLVTLQSRADWPSAYGRRIPWRTAYDQALYEWSLS